MAGVVPRWGACASPHYDIIHRRAMCRGNRWQSANGSVYRPLSDTIEMDTGMMDTGMMDTGMMDTGMMNTGMMNTGL